MTNTDSTAGARKLVYYVACTVDGFIARENGAFDCFLSEGEHLADLVRLFPDTIPGHMRGPLGVTAPNQRFDTVLMGRKTYAVGLDLCITSPYPHLAQYVFSKSLTDSPDAAVTVVRDDPAGLVRTLKARPGKDIWLCGGADLAAAVLPEIDEFILKVNPVLLGTGIPLVSGAADAIALTLTDRQVYPNGFMRLHYRPQRGRV